jgi:asparagine N-glycosylation enzyme membrane subunit Stt3
MRALPMSSFGEWPESWIDRIAVVLAICAMLVVSFLIAAGIYGHVMDGTMGAAWFVAAVVCLAGPVAFHPKGAGDELGDLAYGLYRSLFIGIIALLFAGGAAAILGPDTKRGLAAWSSIYAWLCFVSQGEFLEYARPKPVDEDP